MDTGTPNLKEREQEIIEYWRECIANLDTDQATAIARRREAEALFSEYLIEWSEDFASLWQEMYKVYCMYTPRQTGHYRNRHYSIGYSSFHAKQYIKDKVQPERPTAAALIERFDALMIEHKRAHTFGYTLVYKNGWENGRHEVVLGTTNPYACARHELPRFDGDIVGIRVLRIDGQRTDYLCIPQEEDADSAAERRFIEIGFTERHDQLPWNRQSDEQD